MRIDEWELIVMAFRTCSFIGLHLVSVRGVALTAASGSDARPASVRGPRAACGGLGPLRPLTADSCLRASAAGI